MPLADQQTFEQDNLIWPRRAQTRSVQTAFKKRKNPRPIQKCINFAQDIPIHNPTRAFTAESIYKILNVISWKYKNYHCEGILRYAEVFLSCCFWHEICSIRWWQSWVIGWCKQAQKSNMRLKQQPAYRHTITTTKWWYEQSTEPPFSGLNKGSGAIVHIKSHKVFLHKCCDQYSS